MRCKRAPDSHKCSRVHQLGLQALDGEGESQEELAACAAALVPKAFFHLAFGIPCSGKKSASEQGENQFFC